MTRRIDLIADNIETPGNAQALAVAAQMFGGRCLFRQRRNPVLRTDVEDFLTGLDVTTAAEVASGCGPIVALDNLPNARSIFGFRLPEGPRPALIVGNERRGIARDLQDLATHTVEIPVVSNQLNCLN